MKRRRAIPAGERCTATTDKGRCANRYHFGERPLLCRLHHGQLAQSLAVFGSAPATWTELRPRGWAPTSSERLVVLGPEDTLRYLSSLDGEPVAIPREGGVFVGVDSEERYARAVVGERPKMAWLRRLALDRPDVERALRAAALSPVGKELDP